MKDKMIDEFGEIMMNIYADRDNYSRGKIIDLAKQAFADVINKNCNLQNVSGSVPCNCCKNIAEYHLCEKCMDEHNERISTDR